MSDSIRSRGESAGAGPPDGLRKASRRTGASSSRYSVERKRELGERLIVLAHHYQRPELVALGDLRGDSYELSKRASEAEAEYIIAAVRFVARNGHLFLGEYDFDLCSGTWTHKRASTSLPEFSLDQALSVDEGEPAILSLPLRKQLYRHYMNEAERWANSLRQEASAAAGTLEGELGELQFFSLPVGNSPKH